MRHRHIWLGLALVSLVPAISYGQELNVAVSDQTYDMGHGFNPVTGQFYRPCVDDPKTKEETAGPESDFWEIKRITSVSEIRNDLNLNAYASTFGGVYKVAGSIAKTITDGLHSDASYFKVRVKSRGIGKAIDGDITISQNGLKALAVSEDFFKKYCGDSFVSSIRGGGEFYALVTAKNISESQAKELEASLNASYGNATLESSYKDGWQKLRTESSLTAEIMQSGVLDEPIKSLTEMDVLLDHARTFPNRLRDNLEKNKGGIPNASSIIYQKYTESIAFGIALHNAKLSRFSDFDKSSQIMEELIETYDLANYRVQLTSDALSNPGDFEKYAENDAKKYLESIVSARKRLGELAEACAHAANEGKNCEGVTAGDLVVPPFPADIKRTVPCNLATFSVANGTAAKSCGSVRTVSGQCVCVECQLFSEPPYAVASGTSIADQCSKMPPNANLDISVNMTVTADSTALNHWLIVDVSPGGSVYNSANLPGNRTLVKSVLKGQVGADGTLTSTLSMSHCQSNVVTKDTCTLDKVEGSGGGLMHVRVND